MYVFLFYTLLFLIKIYNHTIQSLAISSLASSRFTCVYVYTIDNSIEICHLDRYFPVKKFIGNAPGSTTFINWKLVTKRGNTAIRDSERKNLFDRIADAHRANVEFIVIIDEEHSSNTAKAKTIIDAFASKNIVRVSATVIENKRYEFFEIDEVDVIDAGLITKALYVNKGVADNTEITDDYDYLLDLADAKRKAIAGRYMLQALFVVHGATITGILNCRTVDSVSTVLFHCRQYHLTNCQACSMM